MKKYQLLSFLLLYYTYTFAQNTHLNLLVGTYTVPGKSEGIYLYDFDLKTGATVLKSVTKGIINPSFLAVAPDQKFVYAVNENGNNSTVSAFKYNALQGTLSLLNQVNSKGNDPCHISVDKQNVIVANYSGGSLAVFKRLPNGYLSEAVQVIQHQGKSIDPKGRQASAHVHMAMFSPDCKRLLVNDLGEDKTYIYRYDANGMGKTLGEIKAVNSTAGSGPRHLTFSKDGKFVYLVHEFNGKITVFNYKNNNLTPIQEVPTAPKGFMGKIDAADIHVSPDGKFLYESNRGDANSISVFKIAQNGSLKFIETVGSLGKGPRNFTIDPSGKFLLVGHQYTNEVVVFNRSLQTGKLSDSGKRIAVGAPVCLIFN